MSARGYATIEVFKGDVDAIRAAVEDYIDDINDPDSEPEFIQLDEVNWLDIQTIMAADPAAMWMAMLSSSCEDANMCYVFLGGRLHEGGQLDWEPVIPVMGPPPEEFIAAVKTVLAERKN